MQEFVKNSAHDGGGGGGDAGAINRGGANRGKQADLAGMRRDGARSASPAVPASRPPPAKTDRAAAANAARLPGRHGRQRHGRETSQPQAVPRAQSAAPHRASSQSQGPFWDGSTIDGSDFSESAPSIADHHPGVIAYPQQSLPPHNTGYDAAAAAAQHRQPRQKPASRSNGPPPFVIGSDGMIGNVNPPPAADAMGRVVYAGESGGLSSAPGQRGQQSHGENLARAPSFEEQANPPRRLVLRSGRGGSVSSRRAQHTAPRVSSASQGFQPPDIHADGSASVASESPDDEMQQQIQAAYHSHPGTPVARTRAAEEHQSPDDQPTPRPASRPQPQVARQLFSRDDNAINSWRETAKMHRPAGDRRANDRKREVDLDYDDGALANMDYSQLKAEEFDFNPVQAEARSAGRPRDGPLPDRLEYFRGQDPGHQSEFFTTMPVRDWEESGDWFLERFGEIMNKVKDLRRQKRSMVDSFEKEVADHEEAVRGKKQEFDENLHTLKQEGEALMRRGSALN